MNPLKIESIDTLHTLKALSPSQTVDDCIKTLTHLDILIVIESGVNNLLNPIFLEQLAKKNIQVLALKDDIEARNIDFDQTNIINHQQWVDLTILAKRTINWF